MSSAADTTSLIATGPRSGRCCRAMARKVRTMRAQRSAAVRIFSAAVCVAGVALLLEQHRARHDDRQRIVELVRDAGEQRTERGELFALVQRFALSRQLFGRALLFGDVAGDGQHMRLRPDTASGCRAPRVPARFRPCAVRSPPCAAIPPRRSFAETRGDRTVPSVLPAAAPENFAACNRTSATARDWCRRSRRPHSIAPVRRSRR